MREEKIKGLQGFKKTLLLFKEFGILGSMKELDFFKVFSSFFGILFCAGALAQNPVSLPSSPPEKEGVPSAAILSFIERLEKDIDAVHSFMILRRGKR
ncbi:MAG: hypothetical protein P8I39_03030, partial [Akkermansiaceae bacterium]|nr:hypothetical protein [Akkermansiaceae bacterium]